MHLDVADGVGGVDPVVPLVGGSAGVADNGVEGHLGANELERAGFGRLRLADDDGDRCAFVASSSVVSPGTRRLGPGGGCRPAALKRARVPPRIISCRVQGSICLSSTMSMIVHARRVTAAGS